jgi:hypothetical protein
MKYVTLTTIPWNRVPLEWGYEESVKSTPVKNSFTDKAEASLTSVKTIQFTRSQNVVKNRPSFSPKKKSFGEGGNGKTEACQFISLTL